MWEEALPEGSGTVDLEACFCRVIRSFWKPDPSLYEELLTKLWCLTQADLVDKARMQQNWHVFYLCWDLGPSPAELRGTSSSLQNGTGWLCEQQRWYMASNTVLCVQLLMHCCWGIMVTIGILSFPKEMLTCWGRNSGMKLDKMMKTSSFM